MDYLLRLGHESLDLTKPVKDIVMKLISPVCERKELAIKDRPHVLHLML